MLTPNPDRQRIREELVAVRRESYRIRKECKESPSSRNTAERQRLHRMERMLSAQLREQAPHVTDGEQVWWKSKLHFLHFRHTSRYNRYYKVRKGKSSGWQPK